jgi:HEAT repeat protein
MNSVTELIDDLNNNNFDQAEEPVKRLIEMGDEISDHILEHLKHEKREFVIANLLRVIGGIGNKNSVPLLLRYYRTSNSSIVRMFSIRTLGEIGDYSVVPEVIQALEHEKVNNIREQLIAAIAELTTKQPVDVLIKSLFEEDSFVREAAAGAIYYICTKPIDTLISNLKQATTSDQKVELIEVLRMVKSSKAIPLLQSMSNDDEEIVRVAIEYALKEIEDQ